MSRMEKGYEEGCTRGAKSFPVPRFPVFTDFQNPPERTLLSPYFRFRILTSIPFSFFSRPTSFDVSVPPK